MYWIVLCGEMYVAVYTVFSYVLASGTRKSNVWKQEQC